MYLDAMLDGGGTDWQTGPNKERFESDLLLVHLYIQGKDRKGDDDDDIHNEVKSISHSPCLSLHRKLKYKNEKRDK